MACSVVRTLIGPDESFRISARYLSRILTRHPIQTLPIKLSPARSLKTVRPSPTMDHIELKRAKLIKWKISRRFVLITRALGANQGIAEEWADRLVARYTESQRHYHTLRHIHDMIECLDSNRTLVANIPATTLAIFFHDWVYDPKAKDNEMESIKCFLKFASGVQLPESLVSRVTDYIKRTITHTIPEGDGTDVDSDLKLFLDFDLEVLSREEDEYLKYSNQIRAEYSHLESNDYIAGRTQVLRSVLNRDRIYFSDFFHQNREQKARVNLQQEIALLEGGSDIV